MSISMHNQSEARAWRIGVISTDYDLHSLRSALISSLREMGFGIVAFEEPGFPVQPFLHSHQACVQAIETMDIVVLLLKQRYGGLYLGQGPESVTEKEFWAAYEQNRILVPCVSRQLFDDRHRSKERLKDFCKRNGVTEEVGKRTVQPEFADDWCVLDFLERLQHADRDQFMTFFTNEGNLPEQVRCRLESLTVHFSRLLIQGQMRWLGAQRSTTGLFESIGEVGGNRLYVSPPTRMVSGGGRKRKAASVLAELEVINKGILLTGEPGVGKTVEIARAFKKYADYALRKRSFRQPFYVSLKGRGAWYHFDLKAYFEESFLEYLRREPYPCFNTDFLNPVFFFDGLDEGPALATVELMEGISKSAMLAMPFAMSARSSFARQTIDHSRDFASKITDHVELCFWTRRHALAFADKYLNTHQASTKQDSTRYFLNGLSETHPIIESPLILSMFLWLTVNEMDLATGISELSLSELFKQFLSNWSRRELYRHRPLTTEISSLTDLSVEVICFWEAAAWCLLEGRCKGRRLAVAELKSMVGWRSDIPESVTLGSAFESLLRVSAHTNIVNGFLHDQFMEYLLARWFTEGCIKGRQDIPEFLSSQTNVDVNRFVKSIWEGASQADLRSTLTTLESILLETRTNSSDRSVMTAANCIYYISRLPLVADVSATLQRLSSDEERLFAKNGILFSLVRLGDMCAEEQLHDSLSSNPEADELNRGLHLEYFKDAMPGELGVPPRDRGTTDWGGVLRGLVSHLRETSDRFTATLRIDLLTIRSYVRARGRRGPLTKAVTEDIRHILSRRIRTGVIQQPHCTKVKVALADFLREVQQYPP